MTETRIALDLAEVLRYISDALYPGTEQIIPVTDNLNTHSPASVQSIPAEGSASAGRTLRMALYSKARQLAGYG